jgi:enoyl-CoA hydratase/carnithine racemase
MVFKYIQTEMKDGVAYLTLNRAPLNWLNIEMMEEIGGYLEGLMKEKVLKLLVIQAMGKAFSVGAEVADHLGDLGPKMIAAFHKMFRLMDRIGVPSIAVVNGSALGGGCELALYRGSWGGKRRWNSSSLEIQSALRMRLPWDWSIKLSLKPP